MDVRHSFTRMKEEMLLLFVHKQYVAHSFNPLVPQGRILRERALESVAVMATYNHTGPVFLQAPSPSHLALEARLSPVTPVEVRCAASGLIMWPSNIELVLCSYLPAKWRRRQRQPRVAKKEFKRSWGLREDIWRRAVHLTQDAMCSFHYFQPLKHWACPELPPLTNTDWTKIKQGAEAEGVKLGSLIAVLLGKILDFPGERRLEQRSIEQWYDSQTSPLVLSAGLFADMSLLRQSLVRGGPKGECLRLTATSVWNLGCVCYRYQQRLTPRTAGESRIIWGVLLIPQTSASQKRLRVPVFCFVSFWGFFCFRQKELAGREFLVSWGVLKVAAARADREVANYQNLNPKRQKAVSYPSNNVGIIALGQFSCKKLNSKACKNKH